ncbi:MAG: YraN family protein [Phycisphaeraceae bacterium]|nr:YraN family protein [Phycisphaeraceae bacterium]
MAFFNAIGRWLRRWFMPAPGHLKLARRGEAVAKRFLKRRRYRILAQNLRLPIGEIDLLALAPDGRTIVVVEVKARALTGGPPEAPPEANKPEAKKPAPHFHAGLFARPEVPLESPPEVLPELLPEVRVGPAKQRQLSVLASLLIKRKQLQGRPVRFDVIGVDCPARGRPIVRHHVAAFEAKI